MTQTTRSRSVFTLFTLALLGALSLPAAAGPNDPVEDVRPPRTQPLPPPAQQEVPEPGTLVLVGLGLVGLVGTRRWQGRRPR